MEANPAMVARNSETFIQVLYQRRFFVLLVLILLTIAHTYPPHLCLRLWGFIGGHQNGHLGPRKELRLVQVAQPCLDAKVSFAWYDCDKPLYAGLTRTESVVGEEALGIEHHSMVFGNLPPLSVQKDSLVFLVEGLDL